MTREKQATLRLDGVPGHLNTSSLLQISDAYEEERSLLVISSETRKMAEPLFEARPEAGEVVERALNNELAVQIPLGIDRDID